ncbi:MAG: hypothetical protein Q7S22_02210 [Candidatus Micrarchaeota archaeon]|nr:hypothetical protein [Candidatus Micrarchaeota archaeon]
MDWRNYLKLSILAVFLVLLLAPVIYAPDPPPVNPMGTPSVSSGIVEENLTIVQMSKTKLENGDYQLDIIVLAVDSKTLLPYLQTRDAAKEQLGTYHSDSNALFDLLKQDIFKQNHEQPVIRVLDTQVSVSVVDLNGHYKDITSSCAGGNTGINQQGSTYIRTNQQFSQPIYSPFDTADPPTPVPATFGSCVIPHNEFQGTCITVVASHTPDSASNLRFRQAPPSAPVEICDTIISASDVLGNDFKRAFSPPSPNSPEFYSWLGAFALLGLLLASMYFSGKNPISLLDINTPKLPSPKGIAAGGQILGPFGYTEMKLHTNKATAAAASTISAVLPAFMRMNAVSSKWNTINRTVEEGIPRSATLADKLILGPGTGLKFALSDIDKSKNFAKGIGVAGAAAGYDVMQSDFRSLLNTHMYQWKEPQHALFGELVSKLEKQGGSAKSLGQLLTNYYLGMEQYKRLEALTGHPDIGKRSKWVQMVHTAVGATVGSSRFVHLSSYPHSAIDSMIRSGPVVARFGSALTGATLDSTANLAGKLLNVKSLQGGAFSKKMGEIADNAKNKDNLLVRTASALAGASPDRVVLGYLYPLNDKMKQQYQMMRDAAYRDIMRYSISETFRKNGMTFNLTAEEIAEHGYKYGAKHLLERMGMTEESLRNVAAFEAKLHEILKDTSTSLHQKTEKILSLGSSYGVSTAQARGELNYLLNLDNTTHNRDGSIYHDQIKLIDIYEHLQDHHNANKNSQPHENEFQYMIAHDNLKSGQAWEAYNVRRMIWEIENGYLKEGAGIHEVVEQSWIDLLNRTSSLNPMNKSYSATQDPINPKDPRNTSMPEFMARELIANYSSLQGELLGILGRHLTDDGREAFRQMNGHDLDPTKVTMAEMSNLLQGHKILAKEMGVKDEHWMYEGVPLQTKSNLTGEKTKLSERKAMFYLEDDKEVPTRPNWWKTDKQRLYVEGLDSREAYALGQYVQYRFTRANTPFHDSEMERQLQNHPDRASMTNETANNMLKKAYLEKLLMKDIQEFMNSTIGYGVYQGGQEQMRFMTKTAAAFLAHALRESEERPGQNAETIRTLEHLDITNSKQMKDFKQLYTDHKDKVDALLAKPLTYNNMAKSKSTWVQMYEGGFVPYLHGMPISAFDRTLGGYVAIENKAKNRWERVDLSDIGDAEIRAALGSQQLLNQYASLRQQGQIESEAPVSVSDRKQRPMVDPATGQPLHTSWKEFIEQARAVTKDQSFQHEKVFAALVKSYGDITGDQQSFWEHSNMRIMPKRDVVPLSSQMGRFFGFDSELAKSKTAQRARNAILGVGDWISRVSFASAGAVHEASWEITGSSEIYKQNLWRMSHDVHTGKFKELLGQMDPINKKKAESALDNLALVGTGYHAAWMWAIDRNPWEMFKDYGYMQRLSSGFQYGPRMTYPVSMNLRPTMSAQEYMNFYLLGGWMMDDIKIPFTKGKLKIPGLRSAFDVYASMFRNAQEELQGSPTRFDIQEHYTKPYISTQPRLRNFFQSLASPTTSHAFQLPGIKQIQEKLGMGGVPMERFGTGIEIGKGLRHTPQEASFLRPGLFAYFRTGPVNPGASILTMRYTHEFDPLQAQMLSYRSMVGGEANPSRAFFKQYNITSEAAMRDTTRKKVDPLMWQYHGEETRRSFGWFTNQANAFASPVHYFWNSGLGFIPFLPQLSPKELLTHGSSLYKKAKDTHKETFADTGSVKEARSEAAKEVGKSLWSTVGGGGSGLRNFVKISGLKNNVPCSSCGRMNAHGTQCSNMNCRKFVP